MANNQLFSLPSNIDPLILPAVQVLPVEEPNRTSPARRPRRAKVRCPYADHARAFEERPHQVTGERLAPHIPLKANSALALLPLAWKAETDFARVKADLTDGPGAPKRPHESPHQGAVTGVGDLKPAPRLPILGLDRQIPAPNNRRKSLLLRRQGAGLVKRGDEKESSGSQHAQMLSHPPVARPSRPRRC